MDADRTATVLVVDDIEDNRAMYAEFLSREGLVVGEATNGVEAIDKAREMHPDVVVMDISMPLMDGLEAARRLREDPNTRSIRIIVLTGHEHDVNRKVASELGVDLFLVKPCLPRDLLMNVRACVRARRRELGAR